MIERLDIKPRLRCRWGDAVVAGEELVGLVAKDEGESTPVTVAGDIWGEGESVRTWS